MKENCIVTLGVGKNYPRGVERLRKCVAELAINCDFVGHTSFPPNIPTHKKIPYSFKFFLIKEMLKKGYRRVIWIDVSFVPLNNLEMLWTHLDQYGYIVYEGTHSLGPYTSDECMKVFDLNRIFLECS